MCILSASYSSLVFLSLRVPAETEFCFNDWTAETFQKGLFTEMQAGWRKTGMLKHPKVSDFWVWRDKEGKKLTSLRPKRAGPWRRGCLAGTSTVEASSYCQKCDTETRKEGQGRNPPAFLFAHPPFVCWGKKPDTGHGGPSLRLHDSTENLPMRPHVPWNMSPWTLIIQSMTILPMGEGISLSP